MTEGKLLLWNVQPGDYVTEGTQIAEIEADKANMEIEAPVDGVIVSIHGTSGQTLAVGELLAEIDETAVGTAKESAKAKTNAESPEAESALDRRLKEFDKDSAQ